MKRKILAILLVLTMVLSVTGGVFAGTSDPNLTSADYVYTKTVAAGVEDIVDFYTVPATAQYMPTSFDTAADAEAVEWSVVDGSSDAVMIIDSGAEALSAGGYQAYVFVYVMEDAEPGASSILAEAPNGGFVNFTIIHEGSTKDPANDIASDVIYQVYDPGTGIANSGTRDTAGNDYYSNATYVTTLDGVVAMLYKGLIDGYTESYGYIDSLTVNGVKYSPDYVNNIGWQYRVYQDTNNDGIYELVDLSAVVGVDEYRLQSGDLVQWKYGAYNNEALFDSTATK